MSDTLVRPVKRGTSNGNQRGNVYARRSRRAWIVLCYQSNIPGFCRCYRCGVLLYNPDDHPESSIVFWSQEILQKYGPPQPLTIDRIIPGCQGGTYRRNNIRPACGDCNSETGGSTRSKK